MLIPFGRLPISDVGGIIHVGAHEAEELSDYVSFGKTKVLWVEANPDKWSCISEKISDYPGMRLGRFAAASSTGGSATLNIASNGQSSSLLPFGTHANSYPSIVYTEKVSVDLCSVDDWIFRLGVDPAGYNFVNLDIQGYELQALRGMTSQLRYVDYVYTEVNFRDVYAGCAKMVELDDFLAGFGLRRVAVVDTGAGWGDAFYSRKSHYGLQVALCVEIVAAFPKKLGRLGKRILKRLFQWSR